MKSFHSRLVVAFVFGFGLSFIIVYAAQAYDANKRWGKSTLDILMIAPIRWQTGLTVRVVRLLRGLMLQHQT